MKGALGHLEHPSQNQKLPNRQGSLFVNGYGEQLIVNPNGPVARLLVFLYLDVVKASAYRWSRVISYAHGGILNCPYFGDKWRVSLILGHAQDYL